MMTIILIAALGFILVMSVGFIVTGDGGTSSGVLAKRTQTIGARVTTGIKRTKTSRGSDDRRKQIMDQLKEAENRERKARMSLSARMSHAGLTPDVTRFWIMSVGLGFVAFVLCFIFLGSMALPLKLLVTGGAAFAAAYGLPRWVLSFMANARVKKFTLEFPTAMDILVRGIRSGLPVHDGFKVIAKETAAPVGPEFERLVENLAMGMSMELALEKMCERIKSPELRYFSIVMNIQQKTGGNLAEALNNLSTVLRARRMMQEKIKALSSEAIASAGIIGSLPPAVGFLIFLTRPDYIMVMFTDIRGQLMLLAGAVWMAIGIFSMRGMINFKF